MNVGDSPTAGGKDHQLVMADAYVPLTQLGFVTDILSQEAESMPDALATLDDQLHLDGIENRGVIAERVNKYRENHPALTGDFLVSFCHLLFESGYLLFESGHIFR